MQKLFLNVSQNFYDCAFRLAGLELKSQKPMPRRQEVVF